MKRKHPEVDREVADKVIDAVETYGRAKGEPEFYHVLDVTGRVVGIGSLGRERYLVLVAGGARRKPIGCSTSRPNARRLGCRSPARRRRLPARVRPPALSTPSARSRRGRRRGST